MLATGPSASSLQSAPRHPGSHLQLPATQSPSRLQSVEVAQPVACTGEITITAASRMMGLAIMLAQAAAAGPSCGLAFVHQTSFPSERRRCMGKEKGRDSSVRYLVYY